MDPESGWNAYQRMVLTDLDELKAGLADVREEVVGVRIDVATLKVKAGIWGGVAGFIPALVTALIAYSQVG